MGNQHSPAQPAAWDGNHIDTNEDATWEGHCDECGELEPDIWPDIASAYRMHGLTPPECCTCTIAPKPAKGWHVYNEKGHRAGTVYEVLKSGHVVWHDVDFRVVIHSTQRWEDTPHGVYRKPTEVT